MIPPADVRELAAEVERRYQHIAPRLSVLSGHCHEVAALTLTAASEAGLACTLMQAVEDRIAGTGTARGMHAWAVVDDWVIHSPRPGVVEVLPLAAFRIRGVIVAKQRGR